MLERLRRSFRRRRRRASYCVSDKDAHDGQYENVEVFLANLARAKKALLLKVVSDRACSSE
jgi:hypothetical protein